MSLGLEGPRAEAARTRFLACYRDALALDASVRGSLILVARVGPSGDLLTIGPREGTPPTLPTALVECLSRALATERFAPPEGGGHTLVVPITLWLRAP
jgi:hypothetical protein